MSTKTEASFTVPTGCPELTDLGKRIEWLRIERGLSKQYLARYAGTSRQQLWRVMTGKSDLTTALRQRLADALVVEAGVLTPGGIRWSASASTTTASTASLDVERATPASFEQYVSDDTRLERSLLALPSGALGRRLKRALLNAIEDVAVEHAVSLHSGFFEMRRRVLAGEL